MRKASWAAMTVMALSWDHSQRLGMPWARVETLAVRGLG